MSNINMNDLVDLEDDINELRRDFSELKEEFNLLTPQEKKIYLEGIQKIKKLLDDVLIELIEM